ncbi:MAG: cobalt-precorrin-5B (C(1))-methyltransferase CbiD [Eubacteriaceae bacterium]
MDKYINKGEKKLRYGYTTGTCALAATKAAITMLITGNEVNNVLVDTPKGWQLNLDVEKIQFEKEAVTCAIKKDSGDDPDITNGIYIYSKVKKLPLPDTVLTGGRGIGMVTRKGLSVEVGKHAINPVPRKMILSEVKKLANNYNYMQGFYIEIFAPKGEEIAKKTFNPRLGIKGGISIIGTTGIVEPMSEKALIDSIKLEINVVKSNGCKDLLIFPGNYGKKFAHEIMKLNTDKSVKISNYIGEMLEAVNRLEFENVLLVAHAGKLIKVAGGIMNTHSRFADSRMEILAAYSSCCGGDSSLSRKILECITTDEAYDLLIEENLKEKVTEKIMQRVDYHIKNKITKEVNFGVVIFTNTHGLLGINEKGKNMLNKFM